MLHAVVLSLHRFNFSPENKGAMGFTVKFFASNSHVRRLAGSTKDKLDIKSTKCSSIIRWSFPAACARISYPTKILRLHSWWYKFAWFLAKEGQRRVSSTRHESSGVQAQKNGTDGSREGGYSSANSASLLVSYWKRLPLTQTTNSWLFQPLRRWKLSSIQLLPYCQQIIRYFDDFRKCARRLDHDLSWTIFGLGPPKGGQVLLEET